MPVAVIPFRPVDPKTRLSNLLSRREREAFARAMLADVVAAVRGAGLEPLLLCTHPFESADAEVRVAAGGLSSALNALLPTLEGPVLVIMADLPLVKTETVRRLVGTAADVAIAPGRGGGTNAHPHPGSDAIPRRLLRDLGQQAPGDRGGGRALGRDRRLVPPLSRPRRGGGPRRPADPRRRAGPAPASRGSGSRSRSRAGELASSAGGMTAPVHHTFRRKRPARPADDRKVQDGGKMMEGRWLTR